MRPPFLHFRKTKKREHVLVTDPETIKDVLDETEGAGGVVDGGYFYITTKSPDNKAIDFMFDRVFGKAAMNQPLDPDGEPIPTTTINVLNAPADELLRLLRLRAQITLGGRARPGKAGRRH